jgi:hypothetical protein
LARDRFGEAARSATGHGGPGIGPEALARIAALDASLDIDFYGPTGSA